LFRFANPTDLISGRQPISTLFCFELTNGRQSRINGSVVRIQRFTWNICTVCTVLGVSVGSIKYLYVVLNSYTLPPAQLPAQTAQIQHRLNCHPNDNL